MITLELKPLSKLVGWAGNPKSHDIKAIQRSLERFGFVSPVVLDNASGKILAGHGRVAALRALKAKKSEAPARVVVEGKDWMVPCLVGVEFANEQEAQAYLLADNRLVELGGWDQELTSAMLAELSPELVAIAGFDVEAPMFETPRMQDPDPGPSVEAPLREICPTCGRADKAQKSGGQ